jgi:hypothetical protein
LLFQGFCRPAGFGFDQLATQSGIEGGKFLCQHAARPLIDPAFKMSDDEQGVANFPAPPLNVVFALRLGGTPQVSGEGIEQGDEQR